MTVDEDQIPVPIMPNGDRRQTDSLAIKVRVPFDRVFIHTASDLNVRPGLDLRDFELPDETHTSASFSASCVAGPGTSVQISFTASPTAGLNRSARMMTFPAFVT